MDNPFVAGNPVLGYITSFMPPQGGFAGVKWAKLREFPRAPASLPGFPWYRESKFRLELPGNDAPCFEEAASGSVIGSKSLSERLRSAFFDRLRAAVAVQIGCGITGIYVFTLTGVSRSSHASCTVIMFRIALEPL